MWATSVPILVFLGISVVELCPLYATDVRQTSNIRQKHHLMPPPIRGGSIIKATENECSEKISAKNCLTSNVRDTSGTAHIVKTNRLFKKETSQFTYVTSANSFFDLIRSGRQLSTTPHTNLLTTSTLTHQKHRESPFISRTTFL